MEEIVNNEDIKSENISRPISFKNVKDDFSDETEINIHHTNVRKEEKNSFVFLFYYEDGPKGRNSESICSAVPRT